MRFALKGVLAFVVFSAVLVASCSGLSPNIRNGRTELLKAVGREGDIVAYLNVDRSKGLIDEISGGSQDGLSKYVYDVIVVGSDDCEYGAIEGDIPIIGRSIVASKLNGKPTKVGDVECFVAKLGEMDLYFDLVNSGVMLFSTSGEGFRKAVDIFIKKRENIMPESVSLLLQSGCMGVYGISPRAKISEVLKDGNVETVMLLLDRSENESEYLLSGIMEMKDENVFRATNVLLSDAYIRDSKDNGRKIDMKRMLSTYRPSSVDKFVGYYDFRVPVSLILRMLGKQ